MAVVQGAVDPAEKLTVECNACQCVGRESLDECVKHHEASMTWWRERKACFHHPKRESDARVASERAACQSEQTQAAAGKVLVRHLASIIRQRQVSFDVSERDGS